MSEAMERGMVRVRPMVQTSGVVSWTAHSHRKSEKTVPTRALSTRNPHVGPSGNGRKRSQPSKSHSTKNGATRTTLNSPTKPKKSALEKVKPSGTKYFVIHE